jgi:hypothetical protein
MKRCFSFLLIGCWVTVSMAALSFTQTPTMTFNSATGKWDVQFTVSAATDVEVSIVNPHDSTVVRHLAAGVLGANPPAPLLANVLQQTLVWDGKDDFGQAAAQPESLTVRVRAGMTPVLANVAAEDLYTFNAKAEISMLLDADGSVFILGKAGSGGVYTFLRKYDASGNYVKTLYPPPAGLSSTAVTGYGINVLPGGGWVPLTASDFGAWSLKITNALFNSSVVMMGFNGAGDIILADRMNGHSDMSYGFNFVTQVVGKDGSLAGSATTGLVASPPWDSAMQLASGTETYYGPYGPRYLTASHHPQEQYLSGIYFRVMSGGTYVRADTSGFWGDGKIFKLNTQTGVATVWLKMDSVPVDPAQRSVRLGAVGGYTGMMAAIHGMATDDSLHVFVCDRMHNRIGVYDTNAVLQGSMNCANPERVGVSKRTGAVYVLTRSITGFQMNTMHLLKFAGWRGSPAPSADIRLDSTYISSDDDKKPFGSAMVVTENGSATSIFLGNGVRMGVRLYSDNGTLSLLKDFSKASSDTAWTFERIAVDRNTERVYWSRMGYGDGQVYNFAISDWNNPVSYAVLNSTHSPIALDNLTVAPNGLLYGQPFGGYNNYFTFDDPIVRFTSDLQPARANYSNTGKNIATLPIHSEGCNRRGLAVGWQRQIAFLPECSPLCIVPDTGTVDMTADATRGYNGVGAAVTVAEWDPVTSANMMGTRHSMTGIKFDPAGNYYVGIKTWPSAAYVPPGITSDYAFRWCGAVVKFAAGTTGTVHLGRSNYVDSNTVTGAARIYPFPVGPFPDGTCDCRNGGYFDVDPYGRLYIPNGVTSQVFVSDNAGNVIAALGQYGNTDSRGPLSGPGSVSPQPAIPIGWPSAVGASEDYLYVTDLINARVARVQMSYALDNMPGLTEHKTAAEKRDAWVNLSFCSIPNPFNPESRISVALPAASRVDLKVYDVGGRLVRSLASGRFGLGVHNFTWNARDAAGRSVAPGLYVYRLEAGSRVMFRKTVLAE